MKRDPKKLSKCREIAGRIWCDPDMAGEVMDTNAAERIAEILYYSRMPGPAELADDEVQLDMFENRENPPS